MNSERITTIVRSALDVTEGLKPVAGKMLGGVKALARQGASLEAGGMPKEVKAAGSTQGEAAPEGSARSIEWESMWDEIVNGINDGRKLDTCCTFREHTLKCVLLEQYNHPLAERNNHLVGQPFYFNYIYWPKGLNYVVNAPISNILPS